MHCDTLRHVGIIFSHFHSRTRSFPAWEREAGLEAHWGPFPRFPFLGHTYPVLYSRAVAVSLTILMSKFVATRKATAFWSFIFSTADGIAFT